MSRTAHTCEVCGGPCTSVKPAGPYLCHRCVPEHYPVAAPTEEEIAAACEAIREQGWTDRYGKVHQAWTPEDFGRSAYVPGRRDGGPRVISVADVVESPTPGTGAAMGLPDWSPADESWWNVRKTVAKHRRKRA